MPIDLFCACGKKFRVAEALAGQTGQCPACGALLSIPGSQAPAAPASRPAGPAPRPRELSPPAYDVPPPLDLSPARFDVSPPPAPPSVPPRLVVAPFPADVPPGGARARPRLYSPAAILGATFFGGPLGGMLILALNYRTLRRPRAAVGAVLVGVLASALGLIAVHVVSRPMALAVALYLVSLAATPFLALWFQGEGFGAKKAAPAPAGVAAVIGILGGLALIGGFVLIKPVFPRGPRDFVVFGKGEVIWFHTGARKWQAELLGQVLQEQGLFDGVGAKTVELFKSGDTYVVTFILADIEWDDPDVIAIFRRLHRVLAQRVFPGQPVEIRLCDRQHIPRRNIHDEVAR
jgi:hypothetical protein